MTHLTGQIDGIDMPGRRRGRLVETLSMSNLRARLQQYSATRADTGQEAKQTKVASNDTTGRPASERTEWWMVAEPMMMTSRSQSEIAKTNGLEEVASKGTMSTPPSSAAEWDNNSVI